MSEAPGKPRCPCCGNHIRIKPDGRPYKLHDFTRGDTERAYQFALEDFEAIKEYYESDSPEWSASLKVWQLLGDINDARKSREKAWWWAAGFVFLMLATGRLILT